MGNIVPESVARTMNDEARALLEAPVRDYRGVLALSMLLMLVQSAAALTVPWLGGELTMALTAESNSVSIPLAAIFIGLIALFSVQALLGFAYGYLLSATREHLSARMRVLLHDRLQALPLAYHNEKEPGDLLTLMSYDIEVASSFITGVLVPAIPMVLSLALALAMMWHASWLLAGFATLAVPLFYLLSRFLNQNMRAYSENQTAAHADTLTTAAQHFHLIPLIKAYGQQALASRIFRERARRTMTAGKQQLILLHRVQPLLELVSIIGLICLLWFASNMAVGGSLSNGALVRFFLYGLIFARTMSSLASLHGQIQQTRVAVKRLSAVLGGKNELRNDGKLTPTRVNGCIAFADIHFAYPDRKALFSGLDFELRAGETVAITGPNGAGKSTLAHLLLRFYAPQRGAIYLDGTDIARIRIQSLREQIAWVPQTVFLFNGSIYDNIAFGRRGASRRAVEAAAGAAQAEEFICGLPRGYDTVVGKDALKLSGGQQQRIALARALLRDAPILILDEATVMFDPQAETCFLVDNRAYLAERTVLFITHHRHNLELADRVVRLEQGRIVNPALDGQKRAIA
jgi:ATP-binding cassette, subfamily B, bacterial